MNPHPTPRLHGLDPRQLLMRGIAAEGVGASADWTPPAVAEIAPLFPAYEIEALIGRGGMGAVYRARQPSLDRLVAIKLLPLEISVDEEFAERFRREARTLARLQHPHILALHDFGTTSEGHLFFVMDYVDGTDLARLIADGALDVTRVLEVVKQVCKALQFAHGHGVVHRDIKPSNILVDRSGWVKVGDFGLAQISEADDRTGTGAALGTPDYAAPEQMRGTADHRADIYSLGVMFYEMLTGDVPRGVFEPPSSKVPVDARLDGVVLRALHEEPERRYQQADELREAVNFPPKRPRLRRITIWAGVCAIVAGGAWWKAAPPPKPIAAVVPAIFTNSLGMRFVPLGMDGMRIAIWETRVRDFDAFARNANYAAPGNVFTLVDGKWGNSPLSWRDPGFEQMPDHPVCGVDWFAAQAFCEWLTERERAAGLLPGPAFRYRLPTDAEWSAACGLAATASRHPWGDDFPPPRNAGNFAGEEVREGPWPQEWRPVPGYRDGFRATAPVGSFPANVLGLHDLAGNVSEWCEDGPDGAPTERWLRGAGWVNGSPEKLETTARARFDRGARVTSFGFRIVLAPR